MPQRRTVFFVSDGTGITAEMLGHSLLTQFEGVDFNQVTLPFVDSVDKAHQVVRHVNHIAEVEGRIAGTIPSADATVAKLGLMMTGAGRTEEAA